MNNTFYKENNLSGLKRADFQKTIDGKETDLFILSNQNGAEAAITNYGGAILAIMVPDKNGKLANVVQGHDSIDHVIQSHEPFLSTLIGRYGNRIAKGSFLIDGQEYNLTINNGPNSLHGAPQVFMPAYGMPSRKTNRVSCFIMWQKMEKKVSLVIWMSQLPTPSPMKMNWSLPTWPTRTKNHYQSDQSCILQPGRFE